METVVYSYDGGSPGSGVLTATVSGATNGDQYYVFVNNATGSRYAGPVVASGGSAVITMTTVGSGLSVGDTALAFVEDDGPSGLGSRPIEPCILTIGTASSGEINPPDISASWDPTTNIVTISLTPRGIPTDPFAWYDGGDGYDGTGTLSTLTFTMGLSGIDGADLVVIEVNSGSGWRDIAVWKAIPGDPTLYAFGGTSPNFVLTLSPNTLTLLQGTGSTTVLTALAVAGDSESITLSASPPSGIGISFSPPSIVAGGNSTLTVTVGSGVAAGTYSIPITGTGTTNTHTTNLSIVVPALLASFDTSPHSGMNPLTVNFTDTSTGLPNSWSWDFGDGGTSTLQNPSHTYTSPGAYSVTLTVNNPLGVPSSTTISFDVIVNATSPIANNDAVRPYTELPHVAESSNPGDNAGTWNQLGSISSIIFQGQPIVAYQVGSANIPLNIKVKRFNGTSWVDLGFPLTSTFAQGTSPSMQYGFGPKFATDGTTLWMSFIVGEVVDFAAYLYPPAHGSTWSARSLIVYAWNGSTWTQIYYRKPTCLNIFSSGPLSSVAGSIVWEITSLPGLGHCWLTSIEFGNMGGVITSPFRKFIAITTQLGPTGMISEVCPIHVDDPAKPLYTGPYYGPDTYDTVGYNESARIYGFNCDAGFPAYISDHLAVTGSPRRDYVNATSMTSLQSVTSGPYAGDISGPCYVRNHVLYIGYLISNPPSPLPLYPGEVGTGSFFNDIYMGKIPTNGSSGFAPLLDRNGEDVSWVKNPNYSNSPTQFSSDNAFLIAVTGDHRPWIAWNTLDFSSAGMAFIWVLNDSCPYVYPNHGRYAWDYAKVSPPGTYGFSTGNFGVGFTWTWGPFAIFDADANIIYQIGWAFAGSSNNSLRVFKIPLCFGCLACAAVVCDGPIWFYVDGQWRQAGVDPDWNVYVFKDGTWHPVCTDPNVDAYVQLQGAWVAG